MDRLEPAPSPLSIGPTHWKQASKPRLNADWMSAFNRAKGVSDRDVRGNIMLGLFLLSVRWKSDGRWAVDSTNRFSSGFQTGFESIGSPGQVDVAVLSSHFQISLAENEVLLQSPCLHRLHPGPPALDPLSSISPYCRGMLHSLSNKRLSSTFFSWAPSLIGPWAL